jgi:hypothetical protein
VISVGSPGSDGSVITEGKCGKAPGDGELLVGVPVSVLEVGAADVVAVSVVGVVGVVDSSCIGRWVGGTTGAAVVVGVVAVVGVVVVTGAEAGGPWTSWMMPQMISPMRTAMRTPHPTNAIGLRHPGIGSFGSGC